MLMLSCHSERAVFNSEHLKCGSIVLVSHGIDSVLACTPGWYEWFDTLTTVLTTSLMIA